MHFRERPHNASTGSALWTGSRGLGCAHSGRKRPRWLLAVLIICLLGSHLTWNRAAAADLETIVLNFAFTRMTFLGVNEIDAKAAFKAFALRMGEKRGYKIRTNVRIFEKSADLAAELNRDTLDIIILDSWDYLTHSPIKNTSIEFVTIEQGVVQEPYLLLASKGSLIKGIKDLRGKRLNVLVSSHANNGHHWLRTELLELGIENPSSFFERLEFKKRLNKTLLPVFFKKIDACIVDQSGWSVMTEMNPQLARKLKVVAKSPKLVDSLCGIRIKGWKREHHRQDLIGALADMSSDPAGKQILTLFRFNGLAPFKEAYLEGIKSLRKKHDDLLSRLTSKIGK
jgi:ABC-type phosphate/phosphonate transport system substrate-binding protein